MNRATAMTCRRATTRRRRGRASAWVFALAMVCLCGSLSAADTAPENTQLALLLRQLDMLERLAQDASKLKFDGATRYHFDYARLYADIARVRAGIQDYLTPKRAQPRDVQALMGQYRMEASNP